MFVLSHFRQPHRAILSTSIRSQARRTKPVHSIIARGSDKALRTHDEHLHNRREHQL